MSFESKVLLQMFLIIKSSIVCEIVCVCEFDDLRSFFFLGNKLLFL